MSKQEFDLANIFCPDANDLIEYAEIQYGGDEIPSVLRSIIESHLGICTLCRADLQAYQSTLVDSLNELEACSQPTERRMESSYGVRVNTADLIRLAIVINLARTAQRQSMLKRAAVTLQTRQHVQHVGGVTVRQPPMRGGGDVMGDEPPAGEQFELTLENQNTPLSVHLRIELTPTGTTNLHVTVTDPVQGNTPMPHDVEILLQQEGSIPIGGRNGGQRTFPDIRAGENQLSIFYAKGNQKARWEIPIDLRHIENAKT